MGDLYDVLEKQKMLPNKKTLEIKLLPSFAKVNKIRRMDLLKLDRLVTCPSIKK